MYRLRDDYWNEKWNQFAEFKFQPIFLRTVSSKYRWESRESVHLIFPGLAV